MMAHHRRLHLNPATQLIGLPFHPDLSLKRRNFYFSVRRCQRAILTNSWSSGQHLVVVNHLLTTCTSTIRLTQYPSAVFPGNIFLYLIMVYDLKPISHLGWNRRMRFISGTLTSSS